MQIFNLDGKLIYNKTGNALEIKCVKLQKQKLYEFGQDIKSIFSCYRGLNFYSDR